MTKNMQLTGPDCAAVFAPEDGGRLQSFRVRGRELLVSQGADIFHYGSFVMAPWAGRLRDACLTYEGKQYHFPANSGSHALHGLVTQLPWRVTRDGELSVELGEPWPWPCRVIQRTELAEGRATFRIEVHASVAMPAVVGWHPWFVRRLEGAPSSAEAQLQIKPKLMWANDQTDLPSGILTEPAPHPWDYCFRELEADPVVLWPGELALRISSDCPDWVIYEREDSGICVEPWTAPPNALNMPNPHVVSPGRPLVAEMAWTWT
jgi:aldose 1-epimerase